ncbi:MAG TPA: glycosyltransferase family 87 protein [Bryobacteraceae bacterium]|nr:glycosyltransferase family 87 protein [Bryobacteraceae bacterium]
MWRRRIPIVLACLGGLALNVYLWHPFFPFFFARANNDFACTYTGAVLAGSPGLYDVATVKRTQFPLGDSPQFMMYQRFPYYAALVSPLRRLPYRSAYWVWQAISFAAFLVFLAFWPGQPRWVRLIACCWSLPLANCFVMGQDVTLVLAALTISMALFFRGRHFAAGCVLALCSIKLHLFLTLPLLILTRRLWRFGAGAVTGGVVLLAASFAVQGWRWPIDYLHMLRLPTSTPSYGLMPNLNGLLSGYPHGSGLMAAAAGAVLLAATFVMWRAKFTVGLAAALLSGLLISYHAFIADAILLLPVGLMLMRDKASRAHRAAGLVVLSPLSFLGFRLEHVPYPPAAIVLLPLAAMTAAAIPAIRQSSLRRRLPAAEPGRT